MSNLIGLALSVFAIIAGVSLIIGLLPVFFNTGVPEIIIQRSNGLIGFGVVGLLVVVGIVYMSNKK